ncbi:MAG TPA: YHS domain-containing protein, partial [Pyrinomonadaceae bacterium]|nr:YHS domain-containing protein [Pyrinomonadaceae bacterium]
MAEDNQKLDHSARHTDKVNAADRAIDPVCGMTVGKQTAAASFEHDGERYFFCSGHCLEVFRKDPAPFLNRAPQQPESIVSGRGEYTCPMHPEIVRDKPRNCPICGMALELRTVTSEDEENPELVDMTRRFWIGVALTAPLLIIAMSDFVPGPPLERVASMQTLSWI